MTTEAITPLRQRMIEDMKRRKLGKHTQIPTYGIDAATKARNGLKHPFEIMHG